MKWIFFLAAVLLLACNGQNTYNEFLRPCNRVDIVVYNGGDTLYFDTEDSTGVSILTNQISGTGAVKDTCAAQGLLRFRQDSTVLLEAPFAVSAGNNNAACNYIAYTHDDASHVQGLSARARKLLHTVVQQAGE